MAVNLKSSASDFDAPSIGYQYLSLIELIRPIVSAGDHLALAELHNKRPVFKPGNSDPLLLAEFLDILRKQAAKRKWPGRNYQEIADHAYDLALDRFSNLPQDSGGPDCRKYYGAFLQIVDESFLTKPPLDQLEAESRASQILQGLVRYNFSRCRLEAERQSNPFWSRYEWTVSGKPLRVWMPKTIPGQARGQWLTNHVEQPDPDRPGERRRVQDLIDQYFVRECLLPLEVCLPMETPGPESPVDEVLLKESYVATKSLAELVAEEKARNISLQRPAIQELGQARLRSMILSIFDELQEGELEDGRMAEKYGISKATFSRFAGSKWPETQGDIPDLWCNTAHVLAQNPVFAEAAQEAGVWDKVMLSTRQPSRLRRG